MAKLRYPRQEDRKPTVGLVNLACCDCGLVHKMGFTMDAKGILRLDFERDTRATAQVRRGKFPYLKTPSKHDKWKLVRV